VQLTGGDPISVLDGRIFPTPALDWTGLRLSAIHGLPVDVHMYRELRSILT
jgi:hypothetical protein